MNRHRRTLVAALVVALAGCASAGGRPDPSSDNVISRSELDAVGSISAYDAIQRLRPVFLRDRGPVSIVNVNARTRPAVFVDMSVYGELESLRNFLATRVQEVRFYPGSQAATKFGSIYGAGVIQLILRAE